MGVGDQQIAAHRPHFQVFQVTHQHFVRGHPDQQRRVGGGDGRGHFTAHLGDQRRQGKQQIGFGTDGDALAAQVEVTIEHGVLELAALTLQARWRRLARQTHEQGHEGIGSGESGEPIEQGARHTDGLQALDGTTHLLADGNHVLAGAQAPDVVQGRAAQGGGREIFGNVPVQGAGHVRHQHRIQPESFDELAHLLQVGRGQVGARQHADAADARVHAVGQREVDDLQLARERHAGLGAPVGELVQPRAAPAGQHHEVLQDALKCRYAQPVAEHQRNPPRRYSRHSTPQPNSRGCRRCKGVGSSTTPEWRATFHTT